jgi:hypothetical protein
VTRVFREFVALVLLGQCLLFVLFVTANNRGVANLHERRGEVAGDCLADDGS